jgi:2-hydroxy fatty acid dioxygenase
MAGLNLNLLDQLTFYGSYHSNKWNQIIHFLFVPCIIWSALVWCAYTGPLIPTPAVPQSVPLAGYVFAFATHVSPRNAK